MAILFLVVTAVLAVSLTMCAKSQKTPSGKLMSYHFSRGGGMNPWDCTIYHLRHDDKTGKALLTISGDCPGEEITVEVGEDVFEHCHSLILQHQLHKSKGYYKPRFHVLDAPSSSFSILYKDPFQDISGSGDMPDFVWDGLNDIHQYFKSIVGDKKAEGHVDRIYGAEGVTGLHWTDGHHILTTAGESMKELKRYVRGMEVDGDTEPGEMGFTRFHDGEQNFVVIHDYQQHKHRLFYSFDGNDATREQKVKRDLAALLCGTFTDGDGRQFVFTADGSCQGPDDTVPQPFITFPDAHSITPQYRWDGKFVEGFRMTKDGVDILGVPFGATKKNCHLVRAVNGNEFWPLVNERFLSHPMLDVLSTDQLEQMLNSIRVRRDNPHGGLVWYTDIGGVNQELLTSEIETRGKEK